MTIDRLRAHWGFTRMPFSKDLAPSMLHAHLPTPRPRRASPGASRSRPSGWSPARSVQAIRSPPVPTLSGLDASRTSVIYLGNPSVGARGMYATIVATFGGTPHFHRASLIPQAAQALALEEDEQGRPSSWSSTRRTSWTPSSSKASGS